MGLTPSVVDWLRRNGNYGVLVRPVRPTPVPAAEQTTEFDTSGIFDQPPASTAAEEQEVKRAA